MTDYKTEIVVPITKPIDFHKDGAVEQSYEITLKAPSNRIGRQCNQLKQGFMRAIKGLADASGAVETGVPAEKEEKEMQPDEVVQVLQMSEKVDYADYVDIFKSLITNGIAFVGGDVKVNIPMFDSLTPDDTDKLLGEYLTNFLLISQLRKLKGK